MKIQSEAFLISDNTQWKNAGEGMQRMILGYDEKIFYNKIIKNIKIIFLDQFPFFIDE